RGIAAVGGRVYLSIGSLLGQSCAFLPRSRDATGGRGSPRDQGRGGRGKQEADAAQWQPAHVAVLGLSALRGVSATHTILMRPRAAVNEKVRARAWAGALASK